MSIGAAVKIFYKMKKEEIQTILYTIKEGDSIKIKVQDKSEEIRLRDHVRRVQKYGYRFCLSHLHDGIFYLEKLKEGDKDKYYRVINRGNGTLIYVDSNQAGVSYLKGSLSISSFNRTPKVGDVFISYFSSNISGLHYLFKITAVSGDKASYEAYNYTLIERKTVILRCTSGATTIYIQFQATPSKNMYGYQKQLRKLISNASYGIPVIGFVQISSNTYSAYAATSLKSDMTQITIKYHTNTEGDKTLTINNPTFTYFEY